MYRNREVRRHNHLGGLGIMLVCVTSGSIISYITYPYSSLISTIFMAIAIGCGAIGVIMVIADIRRRK